MTKDEQLALIREKCGAVLGYEDPTFIQDCTYRLADVLLAMKPSALTNVHIETNGNICVRESGKDNFSVMAMYNLHKDNLTLQSDETIQFLADLLT